MNQDETRSNIKDVTPWYTEEFISNSVVNFLKLNGYKVQVENVTKANEKTEKVITASKFITKEIIEVKGLKVVGNRSSLLNVFENNVPLQQIKNSFSDSILNSLTNFGKYYSDESAIVAMALPNLERYKAIIENVTHYFTSNNLYFKIYLVNENGEVEISNLNEKQG